MKNSSRFLLAAAVSAFVSFEVAASGFQLSEASITNMSRAFAGAGVVGDDLSAAFYNPAGMTLYKWRGVQLGFTYINIESEFTGTRTIGGATASGSATGRIQAALPSAYIVNPIDENSVFGLSLSVPFGLGTTYSQRSLAAPLAVDSDLRMLEFDATMARRFGGLSLGAGIGVQEGSAKLSQAHPVSGQLIELDGDDARLAFNMGAMYEFDERNRAGIAFRPSAHHTMKGSANTGDPIRAEIRTPELITLSSFHKIAERLALTSTIKWTNWSRFKKLEIMNTSTGSVMSSVDESWEDTLMFALGLDWFASREWTLRAGVARDETPIPDKEHRTARIPDNTRWLLSAGASWMPDDDVQIDFGYTSFLIQDGKIDNTSGLMNLSGEYRSNKAASLAGISALVKF